MNKQRLIGLGILCFLAMAWTGGAARGQDGEPPSGSKAENPPLLIPGLKDDAGAPRKPTIAEALGFSAEDQETGVVEATAQFTLEENSRKGVLSLTGTITPGWHIYSLTQQKGATRP